MLWALLTLMTVLASVGLAIPLIRRRERQTGQRDDAVTVLQHQMADLEVQAQSGALAEPEAEALKTDLKRRVLSEGRQTEAPARPLADRTLLIVAMTIVTVVTLAGTGLYLKIGRPDLKASPGQAASVAPSDLPSSHPQGDTSAMIAELETQMKQHPDNAEGWRMLGWSYLQTGRNAEAAVAYGKAVELDPKNAEYLSAQGESTVLAAGGQVTPAAEGIFRRAVASDPDDPRARYYLAVAKDQRGEHEAAMNDWITLLKSAPADAPWAAEVRTFVEKVAADRKMDIRSRLPAVSASPASEAQARGPSQAQVAAAQGMTPADRQAMIEGMVNGLAERLKQNPKDRGGWERLMRARMQLGQTGQAAAAFRDGSRAFSGSAADQQSLRQTATQLGVPVS